jgi:deoxyribose-phosphate aldolase
MNRTANPTADANRLMEDSMKLQDNLKRIEEINVLRQKEMTLAASVLIQLANQVKTSTDKGKPDATSIMDLRKVELIEKLAHNIQNKMRATVSN